MELNEAIDNINLLITNLENMSVKEIEPENYILLNSLNTVLEELNNRIPIKDIEDKIEELENIKLCGGAVNKAICEEKIQLLKNILKWRN